ncbi:MAG: hypothetical protein R6X05_09805 [Desulfobacterales bacterium]
MKEKRNLHLKVQELCDCYASTDPLKEMSEVKNESDLEEGALKWVALAALHGVNSSAKKITITRTPQGDVKVTAKYRTAELPSPGKIIGDKVFTALREITHIETEKGKTPLALGIRDSSLEVKIAFKSKDEGETVSLKFPD